VNSRGYIYHRNNICNKFFAWSEGRSAAESFPVTPLDGVVRFERQGSREYEGTDANVTLAPFARAGLTGRMVAWLELL